MPTFLVSLGAVLAIAGSAAAEAPTISKSELRSNPPALTHRQLRDVIWAMFRQDDYRRGKPPTRPLGDLQFRTHIVATDVPGLCRYDGVRVEFEKVDPRASDADARVRAVGLSSRHMFMFVTPPTADYDTIVDYDHPQPSRTCSGLPNDMRGFEAPDERDATLAYRSLTMLLDTARAGKTLQLQCDLFPNDQQPCEAVIASLQAERLDSVEECDAQIGTVCQKLYVDDRLITIKTTAMVSPGPPPGQIVSVKFESLVVVADSVID